MTKNRAHNFRRWRRQHPIVLRTFKWWVVPLGGGMLMLLGWLTHIAPFLIPIASAWLLLQLALCAYQIVAAMQHGYREYRHMRAVSRIATLERELAQDEEDELAGLRANPFHGNPALTEVEVAQPAFSEDDIQYVYKGGARRPKLPPPGRDNIIRKSGGPRIVESNYDDEMRMRKQQQALDDLDSKLSALERAYALQQQAKQRRRDEEAKYQWYAEHSKDFLELQRKVREAINKEQPTDE